MKSVASGSSPLPNQTGFATAMISHDLESHTEKIGGGQFPIGGGPLPILIYTYWGRPVPVGDCQFPN